MKLTGIPIVGGIAIGRVMRYVPESEIVSSEPGEWTEEELVRFHCAKAAVENQLRQLVRSTAAESPSHGDIFHAHLAMLEDKLLNDEIVDGISNRHLCASVAVRSVFDRYEAILRQTGAPLIQERAADLADIKLRLLRFLAGQTHQGLSQLPGPVVIVARGMLPSDMATMDRQNVLAIVTQGGSRTSHAAIIARSYDIPSVLGVEGALSLLEDGETVVVDGEKGCVLAKLSEAEMECYRLLRDQLEQEKKEQLGIREALPITRDGARISVKLNVEGLTQEVLDARSCVDGVGLLRSEFLYMNRWDLPTEEEQFEIYRRVTEAFQGKPVTLRTLDLGGDKKADCLDMPGEENPFLGNRALRLCLSKPELFRVQLRAALRAAAYGNLRLMFPMVSSVEDIRRAKAVLEEAKAELRRRGQPFQEHIPVGIMIEIPSIALVADLAASEVDFSSIGSNDLCQYMMAADRRNPAVADYLQTFHPAVLRLIAQVTEAFHRQGKPVSACGEMAGDPVAAMALIGLGVDVLSMGVSSLPVVKRMITSISLEEVKQCTNGLKQLCLAEDIQASLQKLLDTALCTV